MNPSHQISARNRRGPRGGIWLAPIIRLAGRTIDADLDTGVIGAVGAREADGLRGREGAAAGDVDLGARRVELRLARLAGGVKRQKLDAQQVLARRDALRQVEVDPAVVLDHVVDAPLAGAGVEGVLPDLEPVFGRFVSLAMTDNLRLVWGDTYHCRPFELADAALSTLAR